jgi:hypothetical protein
MSHSSKEGLHIDQPSIRLVTEILAAVKPALLAADREWREVAAKEAPQFRALSLLGPDENGLSDIIAELLDPRASHGQGETFLTLFSSRCGPVGSYPKDCVTVHRESCTVKHRRMDILIDGGIWGIGIENKPWAGEQKDQLHDYADDLESRFGKNFLLIRLTGRDVDVKSMDAERQKELSEHGKFASWRYDTDLLPWLNECRHPRHCQSARVSTFIDEFTRYITAEFVMATNPRADMERKHVLPALESILAKDTSQLQSVAAIAEAFLELRQKFISKLFDEVQEDVLARLGADWCADRCEENFVETYWAAFEFAHKDWRDLYRVRLESQPGYGLVVLGVFHRKEKGVTRNDEVAMDLKRLGWGKKSGGPYWDAHSPLPEPFTNWTTASGFAAVVKQRAELKTLLIEEFVKLCTHFKRPLAKLAKAAARER